MHRREVRLYNLIFPLWLIVWVPGWWWLLIIPANFVVDYMVLQGCFKKRGVLNDKEILKKNAWKSWLLGFAADFIGTILLIVIYAFAAFFGDWLWHNTSGLLSDLGKVLALWSGSSMLSCWNNPLAFQVNCYAVALAGFLVYLFNYRVLRKKEGIGEEDAKYTAKWMAILTAPYLMLLPFYIY